MWTEGKNLRVILTRAVSVNLPQGVKTRGFLTEKLFSKKNCRPWSINVGLRSNPKDACLKAVHIPILYINLNTIQIWIQSRIDYATQHSETWVKKQSYSQQKMCFTLVVQRLKFIPFRNTDLSYWVIWYVTDILIKVSLPSVLCRLLFQDNPKQTYFLIDP